MNWQQVLVPPGAGVYTVSSGNQYKNSLWQKYYQTIDPQDVQNKWSKQLAKIHLTSSQHSPQIFACPSDTGAGIIKGSNWGPLFLRQALISGGISSEELQADDLGDLKVNPHLLHDDLLAPHIIQHIQKSMYPDFDHKDQVQLPVSALSQIDFLTNIFWKNNFLHNIFSSRRSFL